MPPVPAAGVPLRVAVPCRCHEGHARSAARRSRVSAGVGKPVVVTVNVPAVPTVNVVLSALVIAGAWLTVRVKLWVASGDTPLAGGDGQRVGAAGARRRGAASIAVRRR